MKGLRDRLIYISSIILDTISVITIPVMIYLFIKEASKPDVNPFGKIMFYAGTMVICFGIHKLMFYVRTSSRERIEFDENGNKKGNIYRNLSAKEKREVDRELLTENERLLGVGEMKKVTHKGTKAPDEELKKLVGLQEIKTEVKKMEALMEYNKKYRKAKTEGLSSLHMCFVGSPGTGKTTVARIMAGILYKYHYIRKNICIEIDASFLKGITPDETLKKTKMVLERSKGCVLFIDEAYSLLSGVNGHEIVAELVKFMEDNKDNFILILAGYQNDMKNLIYSNPGLYSRISKYMWFKDYGMSELRDIFTAAANSAGYNVDYAAYEKFETRIMGERKGKNFGNARTVKNIFKEAVDRHAYNVMTGFIGKDMAYTITQHDIDTETEGKRIFNL